MKIVMNLKGNFKVVPEGERVLTITKAECTPSGKPNKMKVVFQDSEGGILNSNYSFDNDQSLFAMGKLLEVALGFEDGDEFDTKAHTTLLVGKMLLCEVKHSQGTKPNENGELPTFANVRRVIKLIENAKDETTTEELVEESPRNAIIDDEDDLD